MAFHGTSTVNFPQFETCIFLNEFKQNFYLLTDKQSTVPSAHTSEDNKDTLYRTFVLVYPEYRGYADNINCVTIGKMLGPSPIRINHRGL